MYYVLCIMYYDGERFSEKHAFFKNFTFLVSQWRAKVKQRCAEDCIKYYVLCIKIRVGFSEMFTY
jgi:hypothetical protein